MSLTLHLGVFDVPHSNPTPQGKVRKSTKRPRRAAGSSSTITTGELAEILENKYHPFRIFFELKAQKIADEMEEGLSGTLENLMMGAPLSGNPFGQATSNIADMFKQFLSRKEMEKLGYPGVPTKAALRGVSHRFAKPYARRAPRPSFIDTGQYQGSATAWID